MNRRGSVLLGVGGLTLAARAVGFGRSLVFSKTVGDTCLGDVYNAANALPNVLFEVAAGGVLAGVVVPVVARHVAGPDLGSGLGLRTMAASAGGYAPLSYHCGSVWPHDTAIVIEGLHRAGLGDAASGLVEGLLRAAVAFDGRLPELWSGEGAPVPYPAACRPQAWSAAAAVVVARRAGVFGG